MTSSTGCDCNKASYHRGGGAAVDVTDHSCCPVVVFPKTALVATAEEEKRSCVCCVGVAAAEQICTDSHSAFKAERAAFPGKCNKAIVLQTKL